MTQQGRDQEIRAALDEDWRLQLNFTHDSFAARLS